MKINFSLLCGLILGTFFYSFLHLFSAAAQPGEPVDVKMEMITAFKRSDPSKTKFGAFTFQSGAILKSDHWTFGAFSGLRIRNKGSFLWAITDKGQWYKMNLQRLNGKVVKVTQAETAPLLNLSGRTDQQKFDKDAEALAIKGEQAFVAYERNDVVRRFKLPDIGFPDRATNVPYPFPIKELRRNEGLEALAIAPKNSSLGGAMVALSEGSLNKNGDIFSFVMNGPREGTFFIKRRDSFNITDADFLPNGDLLVLERRFTLLGGLNMRIRLIDDEDIHSGRTIDGPILLDIDFNHAIDNMEGLSVWKNDIGETIVSLISDDNQNFLQSTLYLEFRYDG